MLWHIAGCSPYTLRNTSQEMLRARARCAASDASGAGLARRESYSTGSAAQRSTQCARPDLARARRGAPRQPRVPSAAGPEICCPPARPSTPARARRTAPVHRAADETQRPVVRMESSYDYASSRLCNANYRQAAEYFRFFVVSCSFVQDLDELRRIGPALSH